MCIDTNNQLESNHPKSVAKSMLASCVVHNIDMRGMITRFNYEKMQLILMTHNTINIGDRVCVSFMGTISNRKADILAIGNVTKMKTAPLDNKVYVNIKLIYRSDDYCNFVNEMFSEYDD